MSEKKKLDAGVMNSIDWASVYVGGAAEMKKRPYLSMIAKVDAAEKRVPQFMKKKYPFGFSEKRTWRFN